MSTYSFLERAVGRYLKRFPRFRAFAIRVYGYANYVLFAERAPEVVHPGVTRIRFDEKNEHFFGYYDKTPWSPDMRRILYHRVTDDGRDVDLVVHDFPNGGAARIGNTRTWNWQQGAMLQWMPGPRDDGAGDGLVVYNNISERGDFVAEIRRADGGGPVDTLPLPVQTVRRDGKKIVSLNYRRLAVLRPDYGYKIEARNFSPDRDDADDGLFTVDVETKKTELVVSIDSLKSRNDFPDLARPRHKVNHAMYAPSGNRLVFLHRCLHAGGKKDRLYVVDDEGAGLTLLMDDDMVSHYGWIDDRRLIVYARTAEKGNGYYLVDTHTGAIEPVAEAALWRFGDGHPGMSRDGRFFVTDSYPDRHRKQHLFLYFMSSGRREEVARLLAPFRYVGERRCDFHPRLSPDERFVSIDSVETGRRAMTVFEIGTLVDGEEPAP